MPEEPRPYRTYRSSPRGVGARLRGETDPEAGRRIEELERQRPPVRLTGSDGRSGGHRRPQAPTGRGFGPRFRGRRWTPLRVLKYLVSAAVAWVLLSLVLFVISAENHAGDLPAGADTQLSGGSTMLFSPETILILGLDNRPTSGNGSKEGGHPNTSETFARTDTIMLWRIGGGASRRLSIPRDTLVDVPGQGQEKINAAWSQGGPALTIRAVKQLTGIQTINHLIVIDLANFPKFIDDIGGVTVKTPKICSEISGGVKNGGWTLNLSPGTHHLDGEQALVLARTRDNSCNLAYNDLSREAMQQQILNGIKSQLFSFHAFFHLPWAAWDAPGVIQTDMGAPTLMQLFLSSEIGGSAKPQLLSESGETSPTLGDVLVPNPANVRAQVNRLLNG